MTDDEIDDLIDRWHESDSTVPLHVFLGMTETEYQRWVERGTRPSLHWDTNTDGD